MVGKAVPFNKLGGLIMADNKCSCGSTVNTQRETVCIDTHKILDSCKDRDCYEDVQVLLTEYGQDIIERTTSVRACKAEIIRACITIDPVDFSRGFYRISVRYYIKMVFEATVNRCNTQEFDGIAVVDKSVVLFGSEGNVHVFRSASENVQNNCESVADSGYNTPEAVVEAVDPVVLCVKVANTGHHCCCCCSSDIPESVCGQMSGVLRDSDGGRVLLASIGIFSVIRLVRPAQLVVNAASCSVPDKECRPAQDCVDPCSVFREMAFPINEFNPPSAYMAEKHKNCGC